MQAEALARTISSWRLGRRTLSEELAAGIEGAILAGRIGRDMRLPSERSLAQVLGVGRVTVGAAYALLRTGGWIETVQGAGSRALLPVALNAQIGPGAPVPGGAIDLARAAPVAPLPAYLAAVDHAAERFGGHAMDPAMGAMQELRAAIASRFTGQGLPTSPEQILVTSGAGASLALVARHVVPPGAKVLIESPTYPGAIELLRSARLRLVGWPRGSEWDLIAFGERVEEAKPVAAYLVLDFHNPTGALASVDRRREVAAVAARAGVTLIVDEAMRDFDLRGAGSQPIPQLPDEEGILRLGSLDKTVWAGLCLGWLRAPAKTIEALRAKPDAYYMTPPIFEQLVGLELLKDLEPLVTARRLQLSTQLNTLLDVIEEIPELRLTLVPEGGLTTWLELPSGVSSAALTRAAPAHGLHLLPGGRFSPDGALDRFLRLPFTQPPSILRRAGDRLRRLLADM